MAKRYGSMPSTLLRLPVGSWSAMVVDASCQEEGAAVVGEQLGGLAGLSVVADALGLG